MQIAVSSPPPLPRPGPGDQQLPAFSLCPGRAAMPYDDANRAGPWWVGGEGAYNALQGTVLPTVLQSCPGTSLGGARESRGRGGGVNASGTGHGLQKE